MSSLLTSRRSRPLLSGLLLGLITSALIIVPTAFHASESSAKSQDSVKPLDLNRLSNAFVDVAQRVQPSVAHIDVERKAAAAFSQRQGLPNEQLPEPFRRFFDNPEFRFGPRSNPSPSPEGRAPRVRGHGSGWVFDQEGHIVTNHHVVRGAEKITVKFSDKSEVQATLVGSDPQTDVAVLKVDKKDLIPARLSDQKVRPGQIVFAFGSPFKYEFSLSQGIVSGQGRHMGLLGPQGYENFIQTDAAINPGNSGGPLTDANGEVVGMNTAIASTSGSFAGIGFAIPVPMLKPVVEQLIDRGKVTRGYLGIWISDDPKLLESFGVKKPGVLVQDVNKDGPADRAGLKAGDVLVGLEDQPLKSVRVLRNKVAQMAPGTKLELELIRDGKTLRRTVKLGEQSPERMARNDANPSHDGVLNKLGLLSVRKMTKQLAKQQKRPYQAGVLIEQVAPGSVAARAGLQPGQLITQVMNRSVESPKQLADALDDKSLDKGVRLRIVTPEGRAMFVLISR